MLPSDNLPTKAKEKKYIYVLTDQSLWNCELEQNHYLTDKVSGVLL